jgi:hypothetical protein
MTELVQSLPWTRRMVPVVLAAVLAALTTLAVIELTNGDGGAHKAATPRVYTAPGHAFAIAYPRGWQALSGAKLRGVQGAPALILRSPDRRAMIVVRPSGAPANEPLAKLAAGLTAELKRRFRDFKPVAARVAPTRGGPAFLYTFARTRAGLVQSIMVTRVRGRAWSLYAVAPAREPAMARVAGGILGTFGH